MDEFAKAPTEPEKPSLLLGDQIKKFDSLLSKINQHREIIKKTKEAKEDGLLKEEDGS